MDVQHLPVRRKIQTQASRGKRDQARKDQNLGVRPRVEGERYDPRAHVVSGREDVIGHAGRADEQFPEEIDA